MTLGQNIARLRAERRLSQGELADALDVSRQSISKWETDASVPELEKLVKLSALFEVSLDELVKGERTETENAEAPRPELTEEKPMGTQRIIGTILLCFGALIALLMLLLSGSGGGLILGAPFYTCGLICLLCKRRAGLWCGWAVYLCVDAYLRYGTGLTWSVVLQTFQWEASWNYVRLAVGWGQFLGMAVMIGATLSAYREYAPKKQNTKLLAAGWTIYAALCVLPPLVRQKLIEAMGAQGFFDAYYNYSGIGFTVELLLSYLCLAMLCLLLVRTLAWLRARKEQKKDC